MNDAPVQLTPTPKAAQAFADFVAMGPGRSLRKLADHYAAHNIYKSSMSAMLCLGKWSSKYHWQAQIANAATARSDALLHEAAELDADTFLATSRLLNERVHLAIPGHTDIVVKMRESVRKPAPKGATTVDVTVTLSVEQRKIVERVAASRGLDIDEVMEELHGILGAKA